MYLIQKMINDFTWVVVSYNQYVHHKDAVEGIAKMRKEDPSAKFNLVKCEVLDD